MLNGRPFSGRRRPRIAEPPPSLIQENTVFRRL